jgi:hypothetical protein
MKICELLAEAMPRSEWIFPDGRLYLSSHFFDRRDERIPEITMPRIQQVFNAAVDLAGAYIRSLHDTRFIIVTKDGYKIPVVKRELPDTPGEYEYVAATVLSPYMKAEPNLIAINLPIDL